MGYDYFDESNRFRNWPNYLAGFLGAALLMGAIVMVFYPSLQRSLVQEEQTETDESDEMSEPESMMLMLPGINKPKIRSIAEVEIDDQAEIIGIAVGDRYRAYLIKSLSYMNSHIINDLIDDVPVSVTYCDRSNRIKVFSFYTRGKIIDLSLAGVYNNELILQLDDEMYEQRAEKIPLQKYSFERTTWKQWKDAHPDTDIYIGEIDFPKVPKKALETSQPNSTVPD